MRKLFKRTYWIIIALLIVAIDQITKYAIVANLDLLEEIEVISNFFSITHIHNEGIAFGMLSSFGDFAKIAVALLTLVMIIVAIIAILKKWITHPVGVVCISFIIGGGIGNLIDRIVLHYVVDFFAFTFWGRDFAIFNVADVFVTVGTFLFVFYFIFLEKEVPQDKGLDSGSQEV